MRITWSLLPISILFAALPFAPSSASASTATHPVIPSIFAATSPSLAGAGWARCATGITWNVDDSLLRPRQRAREVARLAQALDEWGRVTGLSFTFTGRTHLVYDAASTQLRDPTQPMMPRRHISIAFLPQRVSPLMSGNGLGFAAPSIVDPGSREILDGKIVLRLDHVRRNSASAPRELMSLYLHELGHVMGLTHATPPSDLMAPIVDTNTKISRLDTRSVQTLMKPCSSV